MSFVTVRQLCAIALVALGLAASAPTAHAQTAPACPAGEAEVTTEAPGFLRKGTSLLVSAERASERVAAVEVTISPNEGSAPEIVYPFGGNDRVRVIRAIPASATNVSVRFRWLQDAGTPAACVGEDNYRAIPVVPRKAKVGDPEVARLAGRWQLRYGRGGKDNEPRWRLRPACDVFGCRTRVRSNGGARGSLRPVGGGLFEMRSRQRVGFCTLTFLGGGKQTFGIYLHRRWRLRPYRPRGGGATRLKGILTGVYRIPGDESGQCQGEPGERERVVGRKL